ncbi:MAG TPA: tetratricopeptide repeat protein [Stellaceae bacterium]|nr:tetratricopeptide repeat protein [Stellaceae bacterium]
MSIPTATRTGGAEPCPVPSRIAAPALLGAGRAHLAEWNLEAALAAFDAAVRQWPDDPIAHYLRGEALFLQRRIEEALASHEAALRLGIDRIAGGRGQAMSGLVPGDFGWMSHMLRGDFASAWRLADADRERRRGTAIPAWPRHMRPVWDGGCLWDRRVLVRCWHGLGDAIQFARYLPLLAARCAAVCVEAPAELLPLLRPLPGIDELVPLKAAECDRREVGCEAEIEIGEAPHAFRTTLATIPAAVPYLTADPARVAEAARRLAGTGPGPRVGIVWASGPWKPERSLALQSLAPLAAIDGVSFVNLQGGPEYRSWRDRGPSGESDRLAMSDPGSADDLVQAAATIAGLDLVITVDTMVAHLAGALAVPVWLMLHFAADWRWLMGRGDSPWYPTIRLFRQTRPGRWEAVVEQVAASLRRLRSGYGGPPR